MSPRYVKDDVTGFIERLGLVALQFALHPIGPAGPRLPDVRRVGGVDADARHPAINT